MALSKNVFPKHLGISIFREKLLTTRFASQFEKRYTRSVLPLLTNYDRLCFENDIELILEF